MASPLPLRVQTLNPIAIPGSNDPDHCGYVPKGPSDVWSYTDAYIFTHNPLGVTMTLTSANCESRAVPSLLPRGCGQVLTVMSLLLLPL